MGAKGEGAKEKIMEVKVLFFGVLTEVTATYGKHYREVKSIGDLILRIQDDFPEVVHYNYRISLNNEIINNDPKLNDGDEVALLPPFAGG
jgi:molybdopterin converting factor small subunit